MKKAILSLALVSCCIGLAWANTVVLRDGQEIDVSSCTVDKVENKLVCSPVDGGLTKTFPINALKEYRVGGKKLVFVQEKDKRRDKTPIPEASVSKPRPPIGTKITLSQYNELETEMRYSTVADIIGPGTELSRSEIGDYKTVMYSWQGAGSIGANMTATFQGGKYSTDDNLKLVSKAQFGLK